VIVKPGQKVERGTELTNGVPHPRQLVELMGVGEARRVLLKHTVESMRNSGININRRNLEPIVAGLINHVQVTNPDGIGYHTVDSVVPYNTLMAGYKPRPTAALMPPKKAVGKYLEEPVLHLTPGTQLTPTMVKLLEEQGITDLQVNDEPMDFDPVFERLMTVTGHDPDWQTRLGGFYTQRSFLKSVHEGAKSDPRGTSYIPALAKGYAFGDLLETKGSY
jgi:hypothetical protein